MTETTKTRAQLVAMALDDLLVVGAGQSAEDEDIEKVDSRFDGLMGELSSRGICTIADENEIPIEWTGPLSELLASECAKAFGKQKMPAEIRTETEDRLQVMVNRSDLDKKLKIDPALRGGRYGLSLARWTRGA